MIRAFGLGLLFCVVVAAHTFDPDTSRVTVFLYVLSMALALGYFLQAVEGL